MASLPRGRAMRGQDYELLGIARKLLLTVATKSFRVSQAQCFQDVSLTLLLTDTRLLDGHGEAQ